VPGAGATALLGRDAECKALDGVVADVLAGRSRVIVLRGEAGSGKSALLAYFSHKFESWHVARAVGVESELELAYSGLHQLCAPLLDDIERLPGPQRDALAATFGRGDGRAPDRFLVGLATLTLFADIAERQPFACIVDDAQWLDDASAQILGFVARRLLAERIAIVCAARTGTADGVLAGLPELAVHGLAESDARALLLQNVHGPIDAAVRDQIISESHGNPLALLELPRTWNEAALAGGYGLAGSQPLAGRVERSYAVRLDNLPEPTRLLILTAAAEPLGDPALLHRAASSIGVEMTAADAAVDAGLMKLGTRVEFAHPLVRSAAYRTAPAGDRHRVHRALADATNAETDPDRRAWHRARAASGPDEDVATELEHSAGRAQARGGVAAAAAFLERATALSVEPSKRAERALRAAQLKYTAGFLDDASALLSAAEAGTLDESQRGRLLLLRARIAFNVRRGSEATPLLLAAARHAESFDVNLSRLAYLEALHAALHAGRLDPEIVAEVGEAAASCPRPSGAPQPRDLLLDGLAARVTRGYAAAAPLMKEAIAAYRRNAELAPDDLAWVFVTYRIASDLWDDDAHLELSQRELDRARRAGAVGQLPTLLETRCVSLAVAGALEEASRVVEEFRTLSEATGIATHSDGELFVAAFRGREAEASKLIAHAAHHAHERGEGMGLATANYATALLNNGLGQYETAVAAARDAGVHPYELGASTRAIAELVEAASRVEDRELASVALERLVETTGASGTAWAAGVEARSRALVAGADDAETLYRHSLDHLRDTRLKPELARSHLVFGEWLRREGHRTAAREQLRAAHELFVAMRMEGFAERARRELAATGEKVRKRVDETRGDLTPQEEQISRLAADGMSNPEIGAMLFLSPRTVEWHLRKVFTKLNITSRRQLRVALSQSQGALA
jgi:DNA-binding CsgD family transcriptional regulator